MHRAALFLLACAAPGAASAADHNWPSRGAWRVQKDGNLCMMSVTTTYRGARAQMRMVKSVGRGLPMAPRNMPDLAAQGVAGALTRDPIAQRRISFAPFDLTMDLAPYKLPPNTDVKISIAGHAFPTKGETSFAYSEKGQTYINGDLRDGGFDTLLAGFRAGEKVTVQMGADAIVIIAPGDPELLEKDWTECLVGEVVPLR